MIRPAVWCFALIGIALSTASPPNSTLNESLTKDIAIGSTNRGASNGQRVLNSLISLRAAQMNNDMNLDATCRQQIKSHVALIRQVVNSEIETTRQLFLGELQAATPDTIAAVMSNIRNLLFGEQGTIAQLRQFTTTNLDNIRESCQGTNGTTSSV